MYASETGAITTVTEVVTLTGDEVPWVPMRITGGVDKLDAATATGGVEVTAEPTLTTGTGTETATLTEPEPTGTNAADVTRPGWAIVAGAAVAGAVAAL